VQLRQLEYLVALARERHFARAAQACHVSQPSLSAAIRKLEHEFGAPIIQRGQRFEGLTPEGERVLVWAHRILAECDALHHDLSTARSGLSGVLRLGAIPTALTAASLLTTPFCDKHPRARVTLESLSARELSRRLDDFELDVALTYIDEDELGAFRTVPLYEERYLLLTPHDAPLAARRTVGWDEVATEPLCLLMPQMRNRRILDTLFAAAGAAVAPIIETDTVAGLYAHVATHRWSTVISHAWLQMFGVPPGMRVVPLENPTRPPRIGLVIANRDPESIMARALLDVTHASDISAQLDEVLRGYLPDPPE